MQGCSDYVARQRASEPGCARPRHARSGRSGAGEVEINAETLLLEAARRRRQKRRVPQRRVPQRRKPRTVAQAPTEHPQADLARTIVVVEVAELLVRRPMWWKRLAVHSPRRHP